LKDGPCVDRLVHFVRAPVITTLRNKDFLIYSNMLFKCLVPSEIQVLLGVRHGFLELFTEPLFPPRLCLLVIEWSGLQGWSSIFDSSAYPQHHVLVCYIHNPVEYCRLGSKERPARYIPRNLWLGTLRTFAKPHPPGAPVAFLSPPSLILPGSLCL
jgi:hypothetical protein